MAKSGGGGGGGGGGSGGLTWVVSCGAASCSWVLLLAFCCYYCYFCVRPLRVWKERGLALKGGKKLGAGVESEALCSRRSVEGSGIGGGRLGLELMLQEERFYPSGGFSGCWEPCGRGPSVSKQVGSSRG